MTQTIVYTNKSQGKLNLSSENQAIFLRLKCPLPSNAVADYLVCVRQVWCEVLQESRVQVSYPPLLLEERTL